MSAPQVPPDRSGWVVRVLVRLIEVYQRTLSYAIGPACRFHPTCSHYAATALRHHGLVRGLWLGSRRLLRCHPFSPGGLDPVPGTSANAPDGAGVTPKLHERTSHG